LAIIIGGIFGLYQLILRSNVGQQIIDRLQRPIVKRVLRESPVIEEVFHVERDWAISLVAMKEGSKGVGLSVSEIAAEGDLEILGINRAGSYLVRPGMEDKIAQGDRLLVYANRKAVKRIAD
jgi:Trk K+ transport system NAD-binding subunit